MTIEQTIEKAIEGGYDKGRMRPSIPVSICIMVLNPLFWKAMGKSLGWQELNTKGDTDSGASYFELRVANEWQVQWHCFIAHLADGGTIEGFFEKL